MRCMSLYLAFASTLDPWLIFILLPTPALYSSPSLSLRSSTVADFLLAPFFFFLSPCVLTTNVEQTRRRY